MYGVYCGLVPFRAWSWEQFWAVLGASEVLGLVRVSLGPA